MRARSSGGSVFMRAARAIHFCLRGASMPDQSRSSGASASRCAAVMACQRTAGLVRSRRAARRTAVVAQPQQSGASVLEWTRDLRTPADSGAGLRRTS